MPLIIIGSVLGIILVLALVIGVGANRYKKAGPHQALITTGMGGVTITIGGGKFVWPVVQKLYYLDLQARKVEVQRAGIFAKNRVPIDVEAAIVYKVRGDLASVAAAAQSLQETTETNITAMVQSVAEGAFRDIVGKMTPQEINEDRDTFQNRVIDMAQGLFDKVGIDLISFVVTRIGDEVRYFESLGTPAIEIVKQDAREKTAEANRAATVTEVEQEKEWKTRQAQTQAQVFEAEKERDILKAQYDATVATERARADQAGPKAEATAKQEVVMEQTTLAHKEADRKEKELLSVVIKPAEAEKNAAIVRAEGVKRAKVLEGEGVGESIKAVQLGEADGKKALMFADADGTKAGLLAKADGTRAQLLAEADGKEKLLLAEATGLLKKLLAEAEGLDRKAEAMKKFTDATKELEVAKTFIQTMPQMIEKATAPIASIEAFKVIYFGGNVGGSGNGPAADGPLANLLKISPQTITTLDEILRTATGGTGIKELIGKLAGTKTGEAEDQTGETHSERPIRSRDQE